MITMTINIRTKMVSVGVPEQVSKLIGLISRPESWEEL